MTTRTGDFPTGGYDESMAAGTPCLGQTDIATDFGTGTNEHQGLMSAEKGSRNATLSVERVRSKRRNEETSLVPPHWLTSSQCHPAGRCQRSGERQREPVLRGFVSLITRGRV